LASGHLENTTDHSSDSTDTTLIDANALQKKVNRDDPNKRVCIFKPLPLENKMATKRKIHVAKASF